MDIFGRSPVPLPLLLLGKFAIFGCPLFFLFPTTAKGTMLYESDLTRIVGVTLYAAGLAMVLIALVQLGHSAAVGLPERETRLKTHGLYRLTRNPVYLGAFLACTGSCLMWMHAINFLLFAIAVAVHIRIVKSEEEFLEMRFGNEWLEYKERVPRFIGRVRTTAPRG
jgi:protein-S-isoprenylcysteine O-methyltransferase Ste14